MSSSLIDLYRAKLSLGEIVPDLAQEQAISALDKLAKRLEKRDLPSSLFSFLKKSTAGADPIKGLYLYGGVGRGKTMMMDMFFRYAKVKFKKRVHFHEFMLEVHQRLHMLRLKKPRPTDPVDNLADEIAEEARLLCFDEFHVANIADAMILYRLFTALWLRNVVVVATSNWAPQNLYPNGLQRDRFLPFIPLLEKEMEVFPLAHGLDYRMEGLKNSDLYLLQRDSGSESRLQEWWDTLTGKHHPEPWGEVVHARSLNFARHHKDVLWASFTEMCARPLGAIDYLLLVKKFTFIILEGVPRLTIEKRDETKRFMTFIDVAYEAQLHLIIVAEDAPEDLLVDEFFAPEFTRTISRLNEMRRWHVDASREKTDLAI